MPNRREFLRIAGLTAVWPHTAAWAQTPAKPKANFEGIVVNDIHSQLTATRVARIVQPDTLDDVRNALKLARTEQRAVCIA
ncbi:MAG TPA: hypothetical protein VK864_12560, partial [Longimicrobiales bacterium]|nr:hypothetical protein [Longimicrobiales bacterium]